MLFHDEARLFCAPDYTTRQALSSPADLVRTTLLHSTLHPHRKAWLTRFSSFDQQQIATIPSLHFNQTSLAIEAARHDQGVVLCNCLLVEEELAQGQLIEPFPCALPLAQAYYIIHHRRATLRPAAQALKS